MLYTKVIRGKYIQNMSDDEFFEFCQDNDELRIERLKDKVIIVSEPTGIYTGDRNSEIIRQLGNWNREYGLGTAVDSNTGFYLPNGAMRSPDAAWISREKMARLSKSELKKFPHVCPDFVVELKSSSDTIKELKAKMNEWMENGCQLGWLIDPDKEVVFVYHKDCVTVHQGFDHPISGEPVLKGFSLILSKLRSQM